LETLQLKNTRQAIIFAMVWRVVQRLKLKFCLSGPIQCMVDGEAIYYSDLLLLYKSNTKFLDRNPDVHVNITDGILYFLGAIQRTSSKRD
jgi:hypothetical protein